MPSSEIMSKFKAGKLHSGKSGKIVKKKSQAKAILMSYLRKEGKVKSKSKSKPSMRHAMADKYASY